MIFFISTLKEENSLENLPNVSMISQEKKENLQVYKTSRLTFPFFRNVIFLL